MPGNIVDHATFIEKGFNSLYSHLENIRFIPRPSDDGVFGDSYCVAKRYGLTYGGDAEWLANGNIVGAAIFGGLIYPYTDAAKLYSLTSAGLTEITGFTATYDATFSKDTETISYLGGGRYPDASTEYTVTTGGTNDIIVTPTTLSSTFIGKYFYVQSGGTGVRQQRSITGVTGTNTFVLSAALDVALVPGDVIRVYNDIKSQVLYPRLRLSTDTTKLIARDVDGNILNRYFPNAKKIINFDSRLFGLHTNGNAILVSNTVSLEVIDATKIITLTNKCINFHKWGAYVVLFFENEIGILKKEIIDTTTGAFIYRYQSISNIGLFSDSSYLIKGSDFYFFGNDNVCYGVSVTISSTGEVLAQLTPMATLYNAYFKKISSGEVFIIGEGQEFRIIHVDLSKTTVYVNHQHVDGWSIDRYEGYNENFMAFYKNIGTTYYTCFEDRVLLVSGLLDEGEPIRQYIKHYGPVQEPLKTLLVVQTKYCFGVDGQPMGGTVITSINGEKKTKITSDIVNAKVIAEINGYALGQDSLGGNILGGALIGGGQGEGTIGDIYGEYIDVYQKYTELGSHYTVEIINETIHNLIYFGDVVQSLGRNSSSVPQKNILES